MTPPRAWLLPAPPEAQALIAAAVMEAAERAGSVVWSGGIPYDEADNALLDASVAVEETIRALITPDAMSALEAYRDREVAKALREAAGMLDVAAKAIEAEEADNLTWGGPDPRGTDARYYRLEEANSLRKHSHAIRALIPEVKP